MNSNLPQKQTHKVALLVKGNLVKGNDCNGLLKVQEVLHHKVFVSHRPPRGRRPSAFNRSAAFAALRSSLLNSKSRRAMGASAGLG